MSVGLGLLKKLIETRETITTLDTNGVKYNDFIGDEYKVYKFINEHYLSYGENPQLQTVERSVRVAFPSFSNESFDYWVAQVKKRSIASALGRLSTDVQQMLSKGDVNEAFELHQNTASRLGQCRESNVVRPLSQLGDGVIVEFDKRQASPDILGIPYGFEYLDLVTDGAQNGDTTALAGTYGSGKTYMLLQWANRARDAGHTPLVFTAEMTTRQCARRVIAIRKSLPHTQIRLGKLCYWGRERLVQEVEELKNSSGTPFYFMQGGMTTTVADIAMRVREIRPSALYVDGAYMLKTKSHSQKQWERVAETAEALKNLATEFNIPVMSTYQLNAQNEVAHSGMAVKQFASVVLIISDENEDNAEPRWQPIRYKILEIVKGREGESGKLEIRYDFARMTMTQEKLLDREEE